MSIGGVLGSLVFGTLCDYPRFKRLIVCPGAVFFIGVSTSAVTVATRYEWISVYAFAFGLFDGCYEMLLPVITRDLVGVQMVGHAIGALYCLMAFPKTLGPPMAGWIFDVTGRYSVSFYVTCGVAVLAALIMFSLNWIKPVSVAEEREKLLPSEDTKRSRKEVVFTWRWYLKLNLFGGGLTIILAPRMCPTCGFPLTCLVAS